MRNLINNKFSYSQKLAIEKCRNAVDEITIFSTNDENEVATDNAIKAIVTVWPNVEQMARQIKWLQPSEKKVVKIYGLLCVLRDGNAPKNTLTAIKNLLA